MKQGFVKVAAVTPNMRVADVEYNVNEICRMIDETTEQGAKLIAFMYYRIHVWRPVLTGNSFA